MKKTLLDKVARIEDEARDIVAQAKEEGEAKLQTILSQETRSIRQIQDAAKERGEAILQERLQSVQSEIGKITDESTQSVQMVHEAAQRNRSAALQLAEQLLTTEYLD